MAIYLGGETAAATAKPTTEPGPEKRAGSKERAAGPAAKEGRRTKAAASGKSI